MPSDSSSPIERVLADSVGRSAPPVASRPEQRIDVRAVRPDLRGVVAVTGSSSNAGKTALCEALLRGLSALRVPSFALKVTRTHEGLCPRGHDACGTCDSLGSDFELICDRARLDVPGKDTGRQIAAGASASAWLMVKPTSIAQGVLAALAAVPSGFVLVAEGNSFRDYASADVTFMAAWDRLDVKPSARHVVDRVDAFTARPPAARTIESLASLAPGRPVLTVDEAWPFAAAKLGLSLSRETTP